MAAARTIVFAGLGQMGERMVTNLATRNIVGSLAGAAGLTIILLDVDKAKQQAIHTKLSLLASASPNSNTTIHAGDSWQNIVNRYSYDTVITMLPNGDAVLKNADDLLTAESKRDHQLKASPLDLVIDCSTTGPKDAQILEQTFKSQLEHVQVVDAPVSGGIRAAEEATLTFMVGGSPQGFQKASPVLERMGKKLVHCGATGTGQSTKLCNNLLLGITMAAVCESFSLGKKLGLDPNVLSQVINESSGRCWVTTSYSPVPGVMKAVPSEREYQGGFASKLMAKDLRLALQTSSDRGANLPLTELALEMYTELERQHPTKDFGALYKHIYTKQNHERSLESPFSESNAKQGTRG
mmetsp:Transcript_5986/g.10774  ORF Transcript_5986/g.10774 Transcript_5986/m.10774 type:complete len:353 (+) Transcript_5986:110-1168(+)